MVKNNKNGIEAVVIFFILLQTLHISVAAPIPSSPIQPP
ncbi:hypothetical protein X470_01050, partial [Bartonella bacilliformis Peru-18]